jgi:hypothetical protein
MDRVLVRLINLHKRNLSTALYKWREFTDKKYMRVLDRETENLLNEN